MKKLVCEMCGSQDLVKKEGMYVCQHCGIKYDVEEAKKLLVEVSGVVKVDNSEKLRNYYELARRAKNTGNSDDGAKYYDLIRQEDPNSWEANFYAVYFKSMSCVIAHIEGAAISLANCLGPVFALITENIHDQNEIKAAVDEVWKRSHEAANKFVEVSCGQHRSMSSEIQANFVQEFSGRVFGAVSIDTTLAEKLVKFFGEEDEWVLEKITSSYTQAEMSISKFKCALKPTNPLDRAIIHGTMEDFATREYQKYSNLNLGYLTKLGEIRRAKITQHVDNIKNIKDVNERFKALFKAGEDVTDLFKSVTLSSEELKELVTVKDLTWALFGTPSSREVAMLIKMGVDVNEVDDDLGRSPIAVLTMGVKQDENHSERMEILNMLLEAGAVPQNGDYDANTDPAIKKVLLQKYPTLQPAGSTTQASGGCYIATAVYGSYDCPEVWTLRRFRDTILASTWYGRAFIRTYYAISPTLVKCLGHTAWFKNLWRGKLNKIVTSLQKQGIESTPYKDINW